MMLRRIFTAFWAGHEDQFWQLEGMRQEGVKICLGRSTGRLDLELPALLGQIRAVGSKHPTGNISVVLETYQTSLNQQIFAG